MTIHHCPYCELRFENRSELEDHVSTDHASRRDGSPGSLRYPIASR